MTLATPLEVFRETLPARLLATDDFSHGLWPMDRTKALEERYPEHNGPWLLRWEGFDMDHATLECELIDRVRLRTREEVEQAMFEFIEGLYNPHHRHSSLNYECPIACEEKNWGVASATSSELSTETG